MDSEPAGVRPAPTRGGLPRRAIVWLTTGLTGATAGLLVSLAVRPLPALHGPYRLSWWMLACGFALTDIFAVHLHFRRDAYTHVLDELPLIAGMILGVPWMVVVARIAGAAVALVIHRRQPSIKLLYNLALAALCTTVAIVVYRAVLGAAAPLSARGWTAGTAATLSQALIACVWIMFAMAITEGAEQLRRLPRLLAFVIPATVFDTAVGLAGLRLVEHDPAAAVLLVVPMVALLVAYRAYIRERQRHDHLRLLYESSHAFHHAHGFDATVTTLLRRAREMLRAEIAQLTLLPADSDGLALRFCLGPGDVAELHEEGWTPDNVASEVATSRSRLVPRGRSTGALEARMAHEGMRDAVAVTISGDGGVYGTLLVANRRSDVATFTAEDLALLEAFGGQVGVSINNGRLEAELQQLAFHDSLTGLGNRALLSMRLQSALRRRRPAGTGPAVLLIDLDDFKTVNDSLGHSTGDRLLVAVADRLRGVLRPSDTIARLGGDEFAVVLEEIEDPRTVTDVGDRLVEALGGPFVLDGTVMRIHASTGIVIATGADENADTLLSQADVAMYRAKSRGKGCWELFEPTMQAAVQERHRLKLFLQRAIDRGSLFVEYQPIVDLARDELVGVEALVRWEHPTRGLISPDEFIPLAEESGLILQLGREVLEKACEQAAAWQHIVPEFAVSVNVSARQIQEPGFAGDVAQLLRRWGLNPTRLILEITERAMVGDEHTTHEALTQVRDLGVRVAIDDFGTGYSSLSCLRDLPVDILKIAKPFVDGLGEGEQDRAFVTAIVRLAQTLQLDMIAEGIERQDQLDVLQGLRCGLGQGWLLGKPMSSGGITELLVLGRSRRRPVSVLSSAG
jgi:diguanylate cyclase (GGDEF)-like protein